jgi:hypothetical protein
MYWSRKWKVHNCKPCNYIGIAKNAKSVCITSGNCTTRKHGREGVLHAVILPDDRLYTNILCPQERTNKYLIKSGLQPNNNESLYSYGYNNYFKNKRRMTYEMKLPTSKGDNNLYGHGGKCDSNVINNCNLAKTTAKFSNKQYYKQGAVDSSSRIDRLRYNTIVGAVKCKNDPNICTGVYVNASGRRESFKQLYNENHPEKCCPQHVARRKSLGIYNSIYK